MIYSEETFYLLECVQSLCDSIKNAQSFANYQKAKQALNNSETHKLKEQFLQAKEAYAMICDYGKWASDYKEKKKALRLAKKELDMNASVAEFRQCELEMQTILDEIGLYLADLISSEIQVNVGNPFLKQQGCTGCHHEGIKKI